MITTNHCDLRDGEKGIKIEIDGTGGKATAQLTAQSALRLRSRLDGLLIDLLGPALNDGTVEDVFG